MKKLIAVFIMVLIIFSTTITSLASASINLSQPQAEPGGIITISGTAQPDSGTIVKITDENGNIIFFEAAETDASGCYSVVFKVPDDITANTLTVTAGSGTDVATALLTIIYPVAPTASTPGKTPANSPERTPLPSSSSQTQPPADSTVNTPLPSPTESRIIVITPVAVKMDDKAGIVTIGIAVSDLPKDTNAVITPDGNTVFVKDAVNGVLWIEVAHDDIVAGTVELVAIGEDRLALATVCVQVGESSVNGGSPAILWLVIGGAVLLTIILVIVENSKRKRRRKAKLFDD